MAVSSNGNLYNISIENMDGKVTPVCKQIDTSSGILSSVGRRMTSLIFGGAGAGGNGSSTHLAGTRVNFAFYNVLAESFFL